MSGALTRIKPSPERVEELKAAGHGTWEARSIAQREAMFAALDAAEDMEAVKRVVRELIVMVCR